MPYTLRRTLRGHAQDIRKVGTFPSRNGKEGILAGSRDKSVSLWFIHEKGETEKESIAPAWKCNAHHHYVAHVGYIPSFKGFKNAILSAGNDHLAYLWDPESTHDPLYTFAGHSNVVCCADYDPETESIVTGSWDHTARIWTKDGVQVLQGHAQAVWDVAFLPNGHVLTASADQTIVRWDPRTGKALQHYQGHTDCVRGLAVTRDGFASVGNDGSLIFWDVDGSIRWKVSEAHGSFCYAVCAIPPTHQGGFVTVGEDGLVKVWSETGACVDSWRVPGTIWHVTVLPDSGDIVTGSSDAMIRVWTASPSRAAESSVIALYQAALEEMEAAIPVASSGNLPTLQEGLSRPGERDGETRYVRDGTLIRGFQWTTSGSTWQELEVSKEVRDSFSSAPPMAGRGGMVKGVMYDFVFDVDVADGQPPLKLGVHQGESPYDAAQRFLNQHQLPDTYSETIVQFIVQHRPETPIAPPPVSAPVTVSYANFPMPAQVDRVYEKLVSTFSPSEEETTLLQSTFDVLKNTAFYHSSTFSSHALTGWIEKAVQQPVALWYPVLDLLRMLCMHRDGSDLFSQLPSLQRILGDALLHADTTKANRMLCLRCMANAFMHTPSRDAWKKHAIVWVSFYHQSARQVVQHKGSFTAWCAGMYNVALAVQAGVLELSLVGRVAAEALLEAHMCGGMEADVSQREKLRPAASILLCLQLPPDTAVLLERIR